TVPVTVGQFRIDRYEGTAQLAGKVENILPRNICGVCGKPVIEDPSDTARFPPVFNIEIAVGMSLEIRVKVRAEPIADRFQRLVKKTRIVRIDIMGGEVYATTEPSYLIVQLKIPNIHMDNGNKGVPRMEDDRNARGEEVFLVYSEGL